MSTFVDPFLSQDTSWRKTDSLRQEFAGSRVPGVAQLLAQISGVFEQTFGTVRVIGEIRSIKTAPSGHIYFDLRDCEEEAQIACALFRRDAFRQRYTPRLGDVVELTAELNIYAPRGQMNLIVRAVKPAGDGDLYARFLALKEKLQNEGLFEASRKKTIPRFPRTVGVVTSTEAAALRDVLRTLANTVPFINVIVYPAGVQGESATAELIEALKKADARAEADVVLLVRGGGSVSDLWSFNHEELARTIAAMRLPVISGVGHETDFTIADMVADVRAATPTAAAVMVAQNWISLRENLPVIEQTLRRDLMTHLKLARARLEQVDQLPALLAMQLTRARLRLQQAGDLNRAAQDWLNARDRRLDTAQMALQGAPMSLIQGARDRLRGLELILEQKRPRVEQASGVVDRLEALLTEAYRGQVFLHEKRLACLEGKLEELDFRKVLGRGFSVVTDEAGKVVRDSRLLKTGDVLTVRFSQGMAETTVRSTKD